MTTSSASAPVVIDTYEDVTLHGLTERERRIYEAGFMIGYTARQGEVDRLEHEADRYYAEMCRRPAPPIREHISYAELCRRRGEPEHAARAEAQLRRLQFATA
jgi:hypothetical protein